MGTEAAVSERGWEQRGGGGRRGREERRRAEASGSREAVGPERPWFLFSPPPVLGEGTGRSGRSVR
jgi:hypothetical protein